MRPDKAGEGAGARSSGTTTRQVSQAFIDRNATAARQIMGQHIVSAASRFGVRVLKRLLSTCNDRQLPYPSVSSFPHQLSDLSLYGISRRLHSIEILCIALGKSFYPPLLKLLHML